MRYAKAMLLGILIAVAAVTSYALAGHIVGMSVTATLTVKENPVMLTSPYQNVKDVLGNNIVVNVDDKGTSASIQASVVYGLNIYKDILRIKVDNAPYNILVKLSNLENIVNYINPEESAIIIKDPYGNIIANKSLKEIVDNDGIIQFQASNNGLYNITLKLFVDDSAQENTPLSFNFEIFYSKNSINAESLP